MKRETKEMNEKKIYEKPEMEVTVFEVEDVIRTSDENESDIDTHNIFYSDDEMNW